MNQTEFARRRKRLMQMMGKASVAILPAAPIRMRNRDAEHVYRQDSDFHYLTGFPEPEAVVVLIPKRQHGEYILFCRERDPEMETWHGRRAGLDGAMKEYGADDAFPITDIDDILPGLLESCERVFYAMGCNPKFDEQVNGWVNQLRDNLWRWIIYCTRCACIKVAPKLPPCARPPKFLRRPISAPCKPANLA